ncbi:MAG TPA: hypothetical protein DCE08_01960 [Ruminococcaceae bacterium]|nr:hypothetical protein [Oscillospiraceae bacterium]
MKKKWLSLVSVVLVLATVLALSVPAFAATPTVTVKGNYPAVPRGSQITFSVTVDSASDVTAIMMDLSETVDFDVFEFVSYEWKTAEQPKIKADLDDKNTIAGAWETPIAVSGTAPVFEMTLKAKADAKLGKSDVSVNVTLRCKDAAGKETRISCDTTATASPLILEPSVGISISGNVKSFVDSTGDSDVTVNLLKNDVRVRYTTLVPGVTTYNFTDVAAGTYTLEISKRSHVTRTYTVTVGTSDVKQDVEIRLKGDINGDGRVNTSDVNRANLQAKGKTTLNAYEFACADVTGDGRVNTSDVNRINLHAKGKSLMW